MQSGGNDPHLCKRPEHRGVEDRAARDDEVFFERDAGEVDIERCETGKRPLVGAVDKHPAAFFQALEHIDRLHHGRIEDNDQVRLLDLAVHLDGVVVDPDKGDDRRPRRSAP